MDESTEPISAATGPSAEAVGLFPTSLFKLLM